jgi:hypothetical protein
VGATPGRRFNGDQVAVLKTIKAKMIVLPALKDHCFPPEDEEFAVSHIPAAELRVIAGVYGHFAGGGAANSEDTAFIVDVLKSSSRADGRSNPSRSASVPSAITLGSRYSSPRSCRSVMYLTMTSGVTCGMSLSGPTFVSCTAARNRPAGAKEPQSGLAGCSWLCSRGSADA